MIFYAWKYYYTLSFDESYKIQQMAKVTVNALYLCRRQFFLPPGHRQTELNLTVRWCRMIDFFRSGRVMPIGDEQ